MALNIKSLIKSGINPKQIPNSKFQINPVWTGLVPVQNNRHNGQPQGLSLQKRTATLNTIKSKCSGCIYATIISFDKSNRYNKNFDAVAPSRFSSGQAYGA